MIHRSRALTALVVFCLLAGCGGSHHPETFEVYGRVTLDGSPVEGAHVVFHPVDGEGVTARGQTDDEGYYELTTFSPDDGAVPGQYTVAISKVEAGAVAEEVDLHDPNSEYGEMMGGDDSGGRELKQLLPAVYATPQTSPEKRTVGAQPEEFNFELKSS